ncbi:MAG TPA: Hsp20/alpha crystallin family protein [Burkholderiaceae bacterium]|nr:Hsp20/alpha crystallin family protein [Burkholderiaceae bacterium]
MDGMMRFSNDVFRELDRLREQMDQLFGAPAGARNIRAMQRAGFPPLNVGTTPETIEVLAFAPGLDPNSIDLTIDKGLLILSGERAAPKSDSDKHVVYAQERFGGKFRRVVSLPTDADPGKVDATYRDGILRVTVHKRESSRPRQIQIS